MSSLHGFSGAPGREKKETCGLMRMRHLHASGKFEFIIESGHGTKAVFEYKIKLKKYLS